MIRSTWVLVRVTLPWSSPERHMFRGGIRRHHGTWSSPRVSMMREGRAQQGPCCTDALPWPQSLSLDGARNTVTCRDVRSRPAPPLLSLPPGAPLRPRSPSQPDDGNQRERKVRWGICVSRGLSHTGSTRNHSTSSLFLIFRRRVYSSGQTCF